MLTWAEGVPSAAQAPIGGMQWCIERGAEAVERLAPEWNALALRSAALPTGDALWMGCFSEAFIEKASRLRLHTLRVEGRLCAVFPLCQASSVIRRGVAPVNAHTPYLQFATDSRQPGVSGLMVDHLLDEWDVIELDRIHRHGRTYRQIRGEARARGAFVVTDRPGGDHVIDLSPEAGGWRASVPRKMLRETARKMRQLSRLGRVEYELLREEAGLPRILESCFELETRGWKGTEGSPIDADPRTHRFYRDLARRSARAGRFALYLLRFDGRLIAYEYCQRALGKIDQLKPSFDPEFSRYSPGNILRYRILNDESERGEIRSYHLGSVSAWKQLWAPQLDPLVRLRIFAPRIRGVMTWLLGPRARATLRRSSTLRRLAASFRRQDD